MTQDHILNRCAFCDRPRDQVARFAVGPTGVTICNECVAQCVELLNEDRALSAPLPPLLSEPAAATSEWPAAPGEAMATIVAAVRELHAAFQDVTSTLEQLRAEIAALRSRKGSRRK